MGRRPRKDDSAGVPRGHGGPGGVPVAAAVAATPIAPLGGNPIACAEIRDRVVDVTLTTMRGVNLHLAAGYVDGGDEDATEERYRHYRATSDAAQVIASYLACHPRVAEVRYPGLKDDATHEIAARVLQGGFGPYVDYRMADAYAGPDGQLGAWVRVEASELDPREQVMALERALGASCVRDATGA